MTRELARRPLLQVALEPVTAAWLARHLPQEVWDRATRAFDAGGQPHVAEALRRDRERLLEAARPWSERYAAAGSPARVPTVGTSEVPTSQGGGLWSQDDRMTVDEAAEVLDVSSEMVRRMCRDEVLVAQRVNPRRWVVSRASVEALRVVKESA